MRRRKPYCFGVYVITDGDTSGLLLKRKKENEVYPKYAYFWLKQPQGLAPTKEIKQSCGANCYGFESYEEYKKQKHKYAKYRDQERIFSELKNYAEAVVTNPDALNTPRELTQDYSYVTKGYPEVLSRFFERENSPLRDFLISSEVFRKCVLKKLHDQDKVVGMAEEFAVRAPHNVFPEENFRCLRPIEKVLEIGISQEPEWFRKRGPVAVDFDDERIYRREKTLKQLNNLIMDNSVSLLEGVSGTGKTVLVLNLAYDLNINGESSVYFFDCAKYRSFDQSQLVHEIESVKGIFIIENIHLEPRKAQLVYSRFKHNPERHILFTTRPSYKEFQDIFSEDLRKIKKIRLEPFDETESIIKLFCSHPATPKVVTKKRTQFLEMSKMNYWILAFALQGCAKSPEKSEPKSWIADEVQEYLRNLETCNDPYCDQYPRILVSISPLNKMEVLTAECYLIDELDFTKHALSDLVKRGEITEQNDLNDNTLYGLPHSSLADAYWEHGRKYIRRMKLRKYEEFIYDYATSIVPNGLQAVYVANEDSRKVVIRRIKRNRKMRALIKNQQSMAVLAAWVEYRQPEELADPDVLKLLAEKITLSSDFSESGRCLRWTHKINASACEKLWSYVRKETLAQQLAKTDDVLAAADFVHFVKHCDEDMAGELFWQTDRRFLAEMIEKKQEVDDMVILLSSIQLTNQTVAEEVIASFNCENVAAKLNEADSMSSVMDFMNIVKLGDKDGNSTVRLCDLLRDQRVASCYRSIIKKSDR